MKVGLQKTKNIFNIWFFVGLERRMRNASCKNNKKEEASRPNPLEKCLTIFLFRAKTGMYCTKIALWEPKSGNIIHTHLIKHNRMTIPLAQSSSANLENRSTRLIFSWVKATVNPQISKEKKDDITWIRIRISKKELVGLHVRVYEWHIMIHMYV